MRTAERLPQAPPATCDLCCTKIENLGVTRGRKVILQDINFHIHCGELTALIGPNGAGKTTLLKAILGEIPHTGQIRFTSLAHQQDNPLVGYVPQRLDFDLGSPVSVRDLFTASLTSLPVWLFRPRKIREKILAILARVNADHLIDQKLGSLSGGELQRVLLALALEPAPVLLLLDEPVSGVDESGLALFYQLVNDLRHKWDMSIILISHDLSLVAQYADRMIFLNKTVQAMGKPEEVMKQEVVVRSLGRIWRD